VLAIEKLQRFRTNGRMRPVSTTFGMAIALPPKRRLIRAIQIQIGTRDRNEIKE